MSMSTVELRVGAPAWPRELADGRAPAHPRVEQLLPVLAGACLLTLDVALVMGAFLLAYWARFVVPDLEAAAMGVERYVWMGLIVGVANAVLFALNGLYDLDRPRTWPSRLHAVVSGVSTALVLAVTMSFFLGDYGFSRLWFAAGWAFAVVGLMFWRTSAQSLYAAARDQIAPANRVLIVGANSLGQEIAAELSGRYRVVGYVDNGSDLVDDAGLPLLGPIAELEHLVQTYAVDELIIALPEHRREQISTMIARGFRRPVKIKLLPVFGDLLPRNFEVNRVGGRPYIGFAAAARVTWLKRASDLVLGSIALLVLAPVLLAVAVAIKLDSPGPVFYRQRRVGKDGEHFFMIKFRSMRTDADKLLAQLKAQNEATGPLFKMKNDPRVTGIGRIIRRLSIDELPQLFNVFKGEMSLVGPRPPLPSEVEEYEDWQHGRLRAIPGMTGLWQVSGRSEVPFPEMVRLDLHYIRNWTLGMDVEIMARTIPAVLASRGAY
jgi:exopolysaccharide biosynthesis polyprenyl glycosylphosphotransferase